MDREWNNLDHVNGYWLAKRSRLFHSIGCNGGMLPCCLYEKPLVIEWNEQGIIYDKERCEIELRGECLL